MLQIAIVGDRFITPELVAQLIREHVEPDVGECTIRAMQLEWPDEPPVDDDELQEFVGDPAEIASFVGDAQVVVTQVAPISRQLIEHCTHLEFIAPSARWSSECKCASGYGTWNPRCVCAGG